MTDMMIFIYPSEASSVPRTGEMPTGAHFMPMAYLLVLTHSIIPLAPLAQVTPSSSAPAPPPLSQTFALALLLQSQSQSQSPANGHGPGTQKEEDLSQLEQELLSSPWYAANALEPPCGSPECPYTAGCYGVHRMSFYTAFFIATQPAGTFGCWRCHTYSARNIEDA